MQSYKISSFIKYFVLFLLLNTFNTLAQEKGSISIEVNGFKSDNGMARILVFSSANKKAFPSKKELALIKKIVPIKNNKVVIKFDDLPYDEYAVSVHHDENGDGKLNTNFLGIPNEPLGCTNDAKGFMGPPSFDKAKVTLKAPLLNIKINMVN